MKDYYYILGIKKEAHAEEIKQSYQRLSKKFHPDKNNGEKFFEDMFKEVQEAYKIISDKALRRRYDLEYQQFFIAKQNPESKRAPESKPRKKTENSQKKATDKNYKKVMGDRLKKRKLKRIVRRVLLLIVAIILAYWLSKEKNTDPQNFIEWSKPKIEQQ